MVTSEGLALRTPRPHPLNSKSRTLAIARQARIELFYVETKKFILLRRLSLKHDGFSRLVISRKVVGLELPDWPFPTAQVQLTQ